MTEQLPLFRCLVQFVRHLRIYIIQKRYNSSRVKSVLNRRALFFDTSAVCLSFFISVCVHGEVWFVIDNCDSMCFTNALAISCVVAQNQICIIYWDTGNIIGVCLSDTKVDGVEWISVSKVSLFASSFIHVTWHVLYYKILRWEVSL